GTWIGSIIAFLGVGFVIFNGGGDASATTSWSDNIIGDLLALASALSWCVYSVILRRLNVIYTTNFITRKTFFYGVLTAIPFLAAEPHITAFNALLKPDVWGNLLFLVLGASILAFFFWAIAVKRLGAVKASNYLYMSPIVSLIAAWIILGEKITFMGYLGCAFIIGGLMLGDYLSTHPLRTIRWRH
ncbi:MAG: DMT family transporter, partial [Muribaculaceae bacterium]|nr:DMT family transporter [Muribaculaceae bacterium]